MTKTNQNHNAINVSCCLAVLVSSFSHLFAIQIFHSAWIIDLALHLALISTTPLTSFYSLGMKTMVSQHSKGCTFFSTPFSFSFTYLQDSSFFTDHFVISFPDLHLLKARVSRIHCFRGIVVIFRGILLFITCLWAHSPTQIQKMLNTLNYAQLGGSGPAGTPCKACYLMGLASAWWKVASLAFIFLFLTTRQGEAAVCQSITTTHNSPAPLGKICTQPP